MTTIGLLLIITAFFGGALTGEAHSRPQDGQAPSETEKLIALTFDDGPDETTDKIVDVLEKFKVRATFFVIGENCAMHPETLKRTSDLGHEIGNHSYHHLRFSGKSQEQISAEILETNKIIQKIIGKSPLLFRPPEGKINDKILNAAKQQSVRVILWSPEEDSRDWLNPGVGNIIINIVKNVRAGDIVLMHDGGGDRSQTLYALPEVIRCLESRGYTFVTVSELLTGKT